MPALHLTTSDFREKTKTGVSLVDFWAQWCGPCRMAGPLIDELADEYLGRALVAKVNVDEEADLAQEFEIMSIPTVVVLKDGVEVERKIGLAGKDDYKSLIEKYLE